MSKVITAVPRPEVHHLPTIFRRLQAGEIRVPAFQRSFRWAESQIIELLDSVVRGYPVGSVLLWEVKQPIFKMAQPDDLPFPDLAETYPTAFVLDGLQRLSSLYGVFYFNGNRKEAALFNVVYDLETETFKHFDPAETSETEISLSVLFSVRDLLNEQKRLLSLANAEVLIERVVGLQSTFQEYLLPTVTISQKDVAEVVEIFGRINTTGTPLGAVDFMRALTWSEDFDLNSGIQEVAKLSAQAGFSFSDETILKVLAVVSGRDPVSENILELRGETSASLHAFVKKGSEVLLRSIGFLKNRCFVHSADLLPYEGQLLAIAEFFSCGMEPSVEAEKELTKWFWTVSLNEQLRGKPDHYVARQLKSIKALAKGEVSALHRRLTVSGVDFMERRFISRKALSSAFVCMFAANGARSLVTGELIAPSEYLHTFDPDCLFPICDHRVLSATLERSLPSARIFANLVLVAPGDVSFIETYGWDETLRRLEEQCGRVEFEAVLRSQFFVVDIQGEFKFDGLNAVRTLLIDRAVSLADFAMRICD